MLLEDCECPLVLRARRVLTRVELATFVSLEHQEVILVGGEVGVTITGPVLDIVLADLGGDIDQGDTCTINGIGYAVEDIEVDGHGNAKLWLRHT